MDVPSDAGERIRLRKQVVELQKLEGKLVDRDRAVADVRALAEKERDAWLGFPRLAAVPLADELGADVDAIEAALDRQVRRHLERLAEVRVEIDG